MLADINSQIKESAAYKSILPDLAKQEQIFYKWVSEGLGDRETTCPRRGVTQYRISNTEYRIPNTEYRIPNTD